MSSKHTSLIGTFGGSLGRRSLRVLGLVCGVVLALVLFAVLANPAKAETFTVTNTTDTSDGTCDADCSLREAINAANATTQADTVTFASGVSDEILLSNGQLRVESAGGLLRVEGPGANQLAVDGADSSRVFLVTTGAEAEIAGLTVRNGKVESNDGGGIFNGGRLTLTNTTVSSNDARGSFFDIGGGIFNNGNGTLTVTSSTISGNSADIGGGIHNNGTVTVTSSTIAGNVADTIGGINNFNGRTIIKNSTITNNTSNFSSSTAGVRNGGSVASADVRGSIISGNNGADVSFNGSLTNTFNSLGSNIVGDGNATGAFNKAGDQPGVTDPGLGPLQDNGGPTQTHAVQSTSPALDAVEPAPTTATTATGAVSAAATEEPCGPTEDQRGAARPQDGDTDGNAVCDIGSFELRNATAQITPPTEDFGNQKEGTQSAPQTFTVENTGETSTSFTISTVSIEGSDPASFTKPNDNCEGSSLAPGETCTIEVVFSPNSPGAMSAVLRVQSDASSSPDEAQLEGTGTAPEVSLTPTTQDYGNQKEGTTSAPQTFTVENTGNANLDVGVVDLQGANPGQFTEQTDNCQDSVVAPGETCEVEVAFSPDSAGDKSAVLRVQSDASSSSDTPASSEASSGFDEAQLSGNGTAIPVPPPVIDVPIVDTPPLRPPSIKPPAPNVKPPKNACTIRGNNKDNVLRGTPKRDVICGFGGNDVIRGLGGNDIIKGGRGHDIIYGNRGNDKLFGQRGNDALFGGKGRDVLLGGKGKNALVGGKGKDVERGGVAPADTKKQTKKLTKKVIKDIFKQVGIR